MKASVVDYQFRTFCLRIEPVLGAAIKIAQYPVDLTMSNGAVYETNVGYQFTGYSGTANFSPSVVDLEGIAGFAGVDVDRVKSGYFDNARWYVFAVNWRTPVEDQEPIASGFLGKTTMKDEHYVIEEMSLIDVLNQQTGRIISPQCDKTFGSTHWNGCKKTPTVVNGSVTSVSGPFTFHDTSLTQADGFFTEGEVTFTSGANAGLRSVVIKLYTVGNITTHEPAYYLPQVGDTFQIKEGCRKRQQDCIDKNNILNFGGFPTVPTNSVYSDRGLHE